MKPQLTEEEFINWWLREYHNTDLDGVKRVRPEWWEDPEKYTRDFYRAYAVTQEQHDEWYEWAINRLAKYHKYSKKYAKKAFCLSYLNVSPIIKFS